MLEQIDQQAQRLMWEVRQQTLQLMTKKFNVAEKTSARDLVTTVDKQNEKMIDERRNIGDSFGDTLPKNEANSLQR